MTKGTTPRGGNVSYKEKGIGFLRAGNVAGLDTIDKSDLNFIDADTHTGYLSRSILEANDILITIAGTLGRTALVRNEDLPLNANQAISIVRLITTNSIDLLYLIYAINSPVIQKHLTTQRKITAIPNLTLEIISKCFIPIPPFEEQKRIVSRFKEILPYINNYEWDCKKLKKMDSELPNNLKKSILQYAIQGKLVEQNPDDEPASELIKRIRLEKEKLIKSGKLKKDKNESYIYRGSDNSYYEKFQNGKEICIDDEIPFEIPQSWEWMRVCNCADIYTGNSISENIKKLKYTGLSEGFNYIGTKDVNFNNTINYDNGIKIPFEEPKFKKAYKNNTLICVEGGSAGRKVAMLSEDVCFGNKLATINSWIINPEYIYLLFQSSIIQDFFKNNMSGIIGGVSINKLKKFIVPVPPLKEQERIVNKVSLLQSLLR